MNADQRAESGNTALAKAINERLHREPMPVGDFLFADEQAVLDAVPDGWAKVNGEWRVLGGFDPGRSLCGCGHLLALHDAVDGLCAYGSCSCDHPGRAQDRDGGRQEGSVKAPSETNAPPSHPDHPGRTQGGES